MASDSDSQDLCDRLVKRLVRNPYDQKEFIPRGSLDALINREAVRQVLVAGNQRLSAKTAQVGQNNLDSLVDFIVKRSTNIFAMLMYCFFEEMQVLQAVVHFQSLGFDDSNLPVIFEESQSIFLSTENGRFKKPWTALSVRQFCSHQWWFLAPVFVDGATHLILHSNIILPFTRVDKVGASRTFAEVYRVTIHPGHHKHSRIRVRMSNIGTHFSFIN